MAPEGRSERTEDGGALVRAYFEKRENLVLFLAARTRDMATAEDLAQELYLKIAASPPEAVKSPTALLYRMASNLLIDHVRSRQRASRRDGEWREEARLASGGEELSAEPAADEIVIARERARLLAQAVAELPPKMGQAFRLHKLEGRSQADTAQAMGVSVKMVEQHIAAAIKNLALRLRT